MPFVGLLGAMFWLSTCIDGLERITWILPLLMVLRFNRYLPESRTARGALDVLATGAYFFLMAAFCARRPA